MNFFAGLIRKNKRTAKRRKNNSDGSGEAQKEENNEVQKNQGKIRKAGKVAGTICL